MRAFASLATVALLTSAACGVPSEPAKQAEEIASVAAEGSLLAGDAAERETTGTFVRVHVDALREDLRALAPALETRALAGLAEDVDAALARLRRADGAAAARAAQHRLEELAAAAEVRAR